MSVDVTIDGERLNGRPVDGLSALAEYPEASPGQAEASGQGTSVVVTLGRPARDRTRRMVDVVGELANRPEGGLTIGKFDLLATYTYARSLRDGFPEPEARVRGITAAVMGARARGLKRGGAGAPAERGAVGPGPEPVTPRKKAKTLTAKSFDQQVAEKYGPWFAGTFLPTMKQLVAARLSYEDLKTLLAMPPEVGSKISSRQFEERARKFLQEPGKPAAGKSSLPYGTDPVSRKFGRRDGTPAQGPRPARLPRHEIHYGEILDSRFRPSPRFRAILSRPSNPRDWVRSTVAESAPDSVGMCERVGRHGHVQLEHLVIATSGAGQGRCQSSCGSAFSNRQRRPGAGCSSPCPPLPGRRRP